MTVYSINKRVLEQSAATTTVANSGKSGEDSAADFVNALQKAASSLFSGSTAASPSAETALAGHFERKSEQPTPSKDDTAAARSDDSRSTRQDTRESRAADRAEKKAARDDARADRAEAKGEAKKAAASDDQDETAATDDDATVTVAADDSAATDTVTVEPQVQPEAIATVVEAPVQQAAQTPVAAQGETVATEDAATETVDTPVQQQAAQQQAATEDDADAVVPTADGDANDADAQATLAADPAQTAAPTQGKHAHKAKGNDEAAQAQAEDLAQRLDDTGAQVQVQVKVADATKPADTTPDADTVAAPVAQNAPIPAAQAATGDATQNPADGQDPRLAAAAQANATQNGQAQDAATQAKPFDAILAAQVEASAAKQADAPTGQAQGTQPVAALTGTSGTTAAQKAQAPQAAQAPRQPQLPQSQQVMDQISVQIAKQSKDGGDTIKVQLKPTELGSIEIKLDVAKDGTVTTVVTADNKDTLDLLKRDQSSLQKALTDAGLKSDLGSMSFNLREGSQQQTSQQDTGSRTGRRRARLEAAAAADAASAKAAAAAQVRWGVNRAGVDIQV